MKTASSRALAVHAFICDSFRARGYPPTIREIGAHFGWSSTNAVTEHLRRLERHGYIAVAYVESRGIRVIRTHDGQPIILGVSDDERALLLAQLALHRARERAAEVA